MIAAERETVITVSDADELVSIWSAQRSIVGRLRGDDRFTETGSGIHDDTEWASFTVPAARWSPLGGAKRRVSDAERATRAAGLAANLAKAAESTDHTRNGSKVAGGSMPPGHSRRGRPVLTVVV